VLLIFLLNAALLIAVRRHSFPKPQAKSAVAIGCRPTSQQVCQRIQQDSFIFRIVQTDYRVTVSVASIVTAFTLTQGRSALVLLARLALAAGLGDESDWPSLPMLSSFTGFLVVLGKVGFCIVNPGFTL